MLSPRFEVWSLSLPHNPFIPTDNGKKNSGARFILPIQ